MNKHLDGPGPLSLKQLTGLVQDAEAMLKLQTRIGRLPEGNFKESLMRATYKWFDHRNSDIALKMSDKLDEPLTTDVKLPEPDCVGEDEIPDFTIYPQRNPKPDSLAGD